MDWILALRWIIVGAIALSAVVISIGFVVVNRSHASEPYPRRATTFGRWKLPPPGGDLDLWTRATEVMDNLDADRKRAERDRDEALRKLAESEVEIERLTCKLSCAQDILRSWTHSGMRLDAVAPRKQIVTL